MAIVIGNAGKTNDANSIKWNLKNKKRTVAKNIRAALQMVKIKAKIKMATTAFSTPDILQIGRQLFAHFANYVY